MNWKAIILGIGVGSGTAALIEYLNNNTEVEITSVLKTNKVK